MLLIFPCVRLDCVSSASKTCLDYVWSVNVFMLSVWAILPTQVSLPSLVEVVGLLHNWIIAQQTAEWRSCRPCLRLSPNLGPRIAFWGPDLGHILVPVSGSIFGHRFGPYNYKRNHGPQNGAQKWNPKQGPKLDPNQAPKCNPGRQICTETQTRTCRDDLHSAVCWAILFNCATNQQLQPKNEGKLGRAKLLKQRAWIHSQTKRSQDMFYLQKIHSQVSRMGKSTACLLLWGYARASPQNCLFWGPGSGTSFCSILRPLLATLLHPWVAEFAAHWKMQNVKLPACPTPAGCICSNSGAICSASQ